MPVLLLPRGLASVPAPATFPVVKTEAQFTQSAWTDITAFMRIGGGGQIQITRGSSRVESPVVRYDAGTMTVPLSNADRRFDPTNLAGPYVSGATSSTLSWIADAANIHTMFGTDPATVRQFFDNTRGYLIGHNKTASPVQDGLTANPVLKYESYAQFNTDVTGGAITYPYTWLLYDPESWVLTPAAEQQDPQTAMANFCTLAHAHGYSVILTPGRDLGNTDTAHPKNPGESLDDWYIRTGIATKAAQVGDVFEVQDQANTLNSPEFISFFGKAYNQAKAANPAVPVWCGVSTNYGTPRQMFNAAASVPQAQGFWLNINGDIADANAFLRLATSLSTGTPRQTQVVPMVPVRVSATFASVTYRLFNGTADAWMVSYSPPRDSVTTLTATDGFKVLGRQPRVAKASFLGGGEDAGARVTRILDNAGWSSAKRSVTAGDATLQATLLGSTPVAGTPAAIAAAGGAATINAQNAVSTSTPLDELYQVNDTEMGELYVNGNGFVVFRHRHGLWTDTRSVTPQATFGDNAAGGELEYANLTIIYDDTTLWNGASIANVGGILQQAADTGSQTAYGPKVFDSEQLAADSDWQALGYAQFVVAASAQPELRFSDITIVPQRDPANLFPQVLGREIGDRITVIRRPPGGGTAISRDVFIRGVQHAITSKTWATTWVLEDAQSLPAQFIADDPIHGVADVSTVGF